MTSSSQVSSVVDGDCSTAEQQGPEVVGAAAPGSAVSSATSVSGHGDHHVNLINLAPPPLAAAAGYPYILMSSPSSQTGSADFPAYMTTTDQSHQQQVSHQYLVQAGYIPGIHGSDHHSHGSLYNVTQGSSHYAAAAAAYGGGGGGGVPGFFHHSNPPPQGFHHTQDQIQRMQEHTAINSQAPQHNFLQACTTQQYTANLQGPGLLSAAAAGAAGARGGGGSGQQQSDQHNNTRHNPPNRRMPNVRQRIRRRTRANRAHIMHINAVAADMAAAYNNRDHSTAASYTGIFFLHYAKNMDL